MPVSHPLYYSMYLAKRIGPYATLGLAEDTWALNEGVTDEGVFLQQAYDIDRERQDMFFAALDRLRTGALVCVFDATDRIQHMFWRYLDPAHPARRGRAEPRIRTRSRDLYRHNDALVGRVMQQLGDARRADGRVGSRLQLVPPRRQPEQLAAPRGLSRAQAGQPTAAPNGCATWTGPRTRAYCVGLTGMFLNVKGREAQGIVEPGAEAAALKAEIIGEAERAARRREGCGRDPRGVRHGDALRGPVPGERAGPADRLQRRLSRVVGRRDAASWPGPVFDDNTKAVERRPLHRSAPRARRLLLQPASRRAGARRSSTSRRRPFACSASSRPPTWTAGRWRGSHERIGARDRWPCSLRGAAARRRRRAAGIAPGARTPRHRAGVRRPGLPA